MPHQVVAHARVPVIKVEEWVAGVAFDVVVNNEIALTNRCPPALSIQAMPSCF